MPLQPIDPMRAEWPQAVGRRRCSHKGLVLTEMNVGEVNVCYGEIGDLGPRTVWPSPHRAAEDVLHAAAERIGLVADDGDRQCWATIRSGLGAGLQEPADLDRNG